MRSARTLCVTATLRRERCTLSELSACVAPKANAGLDHSQMPIRLAYHPACSMSGDGKADKAQPSGVWETLDWGSLLFGVRRWPAGPLDVHVEPSVAVASLLLEFVGGKRPTLPGCSTVRPAFAPSCGPGSLLWPV